MKRMRGLRLGGNCNCNGKEVGFVCAKGPAKEKKKRQHRNARCPSVRFARKLLLKLKLGAGINHETTAKPGHSGMMRKRQDEERGFALPRHC